MADQFSTPTRATGPESDYSTTSSTESTPGVAKEQAAQVGQGATEAGRRVAGTASEQASQVASEAAGQARNLYDQTREELRGQASTQQERLAGSIRSLSTELASMADRGNAGPASDLVREASSRAGDVAGWLDNRDPGGVLQEVTDFARRRPGTFLAIAAGAGLIAGRLTRGAISEARHESGSSSAATGSTTGPSFGTPPAPVAGSTGAPVSGYSHPAPVAGNGLTDDRLAGDPLVEPVPYERYEAVENAPYEETVPGRGFPDERREGL